MADAGRRRVDDRLALEVASRVTARDRYVCRLLLDHQVLTTGQIQQVTFPSERTAQLRLAQLRRLRVIDRFRPLVATGSAPSHWILDSLGAAVLAAEDGVEVLELPWRRGRSISLAQSGQLRHALAVNGFFCSLLAEARVRVDSELVMWWPARRCAAAWGDIVRPDGYGVWAEAGRQIAFLLEYRDGRDQAGQLAERLEAYARLFDATGQRVPVLFVFPGPSQEAQARKVLSHPTVLLATTAPMHGQSPSEEVWLRNASWGGPERCRLIDLLLPPPAC
ncbi:MAG TPA: replication-relaxation family protein [Acidimicrobiales bacterium]|nr:replication-relaxation family protein [Acidimicrobiales bacterium]